MSASVLSAFAVPPMMLGEASEPRSQLERGAHLVTYAEAAGDVMLVLHDPAAFTYYRRRMLQLLGVSPSHKDSTR